jgi:hypothetical protein
MSAIFISHSSKDNAVAVEIRDWLDGLGHHSVFLDFDPADGIPAGRDWEQELYRRIRACRAVIVLCSRHSMASRWCFMEITHARALGKHLFPVKIDDCELDGVLTDRQVTDLTGDRTAALERLGRGILASGLDPADAFDRDPARPLYPGLLAFQEEDAAIFFGRDDEIGDGLDLVNRVRRLGQTKLVMILGASGTGKSSLVRAGLLPRLRRDIERWLVVDTFRPRDEPARALGVALNRAFEQVGRRLPWQRISEQLQAAMAGARREEATPPGFGEPEPASAAQARPEADNSSPSRFLDKVEELEAALPEGASAQTVRYLRLLRAAVSAPDSRPGKTGSGDDDTGDNDILVELALDLIRRSKRDEARVLLVIDQFEELLGHSPDHPNSRFLRLLRASLETSGSPLVAIGTMRSDFLEAFQKSPDLLDLRYESLSLGPMSTEDVAQVIEKPAALAALDLEPGLVQALVGDAETEDALPLLAFTLRELNERYGEDGLLEIDEYRDKLGGLHGAVAKAADEILAAQRLSHVEEVALRKAFLRLVRPTEEGTYARRTARWDDLPAAAHPVLERLVQGRLLVSSGDETGATLEVAHESLFRSWGRLVHWLDEAAEALRLGREIELAAGGWDAAGRAVDDLWRGGRLARARELMTGGDLPLAEPALTFIAASHDEEEAQARAKETRRRRILRGVVGGAAVAAVLAVVAILFAIRANRAERDRANRAERDAVASAREAALEAMAATRTALETEERLVALNRTRYKDIVRGLEWEVDELLADGGPLQASRSALSERDAAACPEMARYLETRRADPAAGQVRPAEAAAELATSAEPQLYALEQEARAVCAIATKHLAQARRHERVAGELRERLAVSRAGAGLPPDGSDLLLSLDLLRAASGAGFILLYGDVADPRVVLFDGGGPRVYRQTLRPRLLQLSEFLGDGPPLPLELVVSTQSDSDSLSGLTDLFQDIAENPEEAPVQVGSFWSNTFPADDPQLTQVAASFWRKLRAQGVAQSLGIPVNRPFGRFVTLPAAGAARVALTAKEAARSPDGDAVELQVTVLGPPLEWLRRYFDDYVARELQKRIERAVDSGQEAPTALMAAVSDRFEVVEAYTSERIELPAAAPLESTDAAAGKTADSSLPNLASMVLMLELAGKRILVTSDARADTLLAGASQAGFTDETGRMEVDALLLPHQGSDRNVSVEFFRRVRARHYLVQGNGKHFNPEIVTFKMLFEGRRDDTQPFSIHMNYAPEELAEGSRGKYPVEELCELLRLERRKGTPFRIVTPNEDEPSMTLDLLADSGLDHGRSDQVCDLEAAAEEATSK